MKHLNKQLLATGLIIILSIIYFSCRQSTTNKPVEIELNYRSILQSHFKEQFQYVDNTDDIDESKIIIDTIHEGIIKLELEERDELLKQLEAGSLEELERGLKSLTANPILNSQKRGQSWYLLGRLYDLMVYDESSPNIKSEEAFDKCGELDPDNPDRLELFGRAYSAEDETIEAIGHFSRAIEYIEKEQPDNINYKAQLIRLYRHLGAAYYENSEYEKALQYLEQGLQMAAQYYKKPHLIQAEYYDWIASIYFKQNKYDEALDKSYKAEDIILQYDKNSPFLGVIYFTIGAIYRRMNNSEAETYYLDSLLSTIKYYGPQHDKVINSYNNVASYYRNIREFQNALNYYNEALAQINSLYQEFSSKHARQYMYIANTYSELKRFEDAETFYNKALKNSKESIGYYSELTAQILNNYSTALMDLELYPNAVKHLNDSLEIYIQLYSEDHIELAPVYSNLAVSLYYMDSNQEAYNYAQKAYKIYLDYYGEKHPDTISTKEEMNIIAKELDNKP